MKKVYRVEVSPQGPKFLATVSIWAGSDQREGDRYEIVSVALADHEDDALSEATREAFDNV